MQPTPDLIGVDAAESAAGFAARLVAHAGRGGPWRGELSTSALSTATAVCALELSRRAHEQGRLDLDVALPDLTAAIAGGCQWLAHERNADGGWGDTPDSPSNVSTTILCWAALGMFDESTGPVAVARDDAETWLRREAGAPTAADLSRLMLDRYGDDRTFSVPILTLCALAGCFGGGVEAWREIPSLPFEVAALPRASFRALGLPMVSYALPALIAIGQARHRHGPRANPAIHAIRNATAQRTLRVLAAIQPPNGGYLEATPLTSFVTLSLVSLDRQQRGPAGDAVVARALGFLMQSRRTDGSWPIDTDLATWVTTQSLDALAAGGRLTEHVDSDRLQAIGRWLLEQQYDSVHAYTGAPPGAWAWTELPGGVPDADDTAGAIVALRHLANAGAVDLEAARTAAVAGIGWLLDLQNRDGGMPTFCRGWGKLPFDRSGADLTAHALKAWRSWHGDLEPVLARRVDRATDRALRFLVREQRPDGAWLPLWFGNQETAAQDNPLYGTTRVLQATRVSSGDGEHAAAWRAARKRAAAWVHEAQNEDGGWGGDAGVASSIEETGLAVAALAAVASESRSGGEQQDDNAHQAIDRGLAWLEEREGADAQPAPIGLYFAKLWYSEQLYPLIFATAAREAAVALESRP